MTIKGAKEMPYRVPAKTDYSSVRDKLVKHLLDFPVNHEDATIFELKENVKNWNTGCYDKMWCVNDQFVLNLSFFSPSIGVITERSKEYGGSGNGIRVKIMTEFLFHLTREERKMFKQMVKLRKSFLHSLIENKYRETKKKLLFKSVEKLMIETSDIKMLNR